MTDIEWGTTIEVNGVRPEWLRDDEIVNPTWDDGPYNAGVRMDRVIALSRVKSIRLPADHPYYLATSRGFTYWPGGESAPEDWDGGDTLFRCGNVNTSGVYRWNHNGPDWTGDIIGYRKRAEKPVIAPELVERLYLLCRSVARGYSMEEVAKELLDAIHLDPDLTLAKSIMGDAEAIALAIKAARENGRG